MSGWTYYSHPIAKDLRRVDMSHTVAELLPFLLQQLLRHGVGRGLVIRVVVGCFLWVGRWVGRWVGGWIEEKQAVGMRCWTLWVGGWLWVRVFFL